MKKPLAANASSSFSCLPDEMVLQILTKLIDLNALCRCKLVSRRFYYLVNHVDAISFTPRIVKPRDSAPSFQCKPIRSAMKSIRMFQQLESLCIQLPVSSKGADHNTYLFKWKVKFGDRVDSFVFLSVNVIYDRNGLCVNGNHQGQEEGIGINLVKLQIAFDCLGDVMTRVMILSDQIVSFPLLETVSISRSGERGPVFLSGAKIDLLRNLLGSLSDSAKHFRRPDFPDRMSWGYFPLLELPVSGYVMKGITLILFERDDLTDKDDSFTNIDLDGFKNKEDVAYSEAVMEILNVHRDSITRLL